MTFLWLINIEKILGKKVLKCISVQNNTAEWLLLILLFDLDIYIHCDVLIIDALLK